MANQFVKTVDGVQVFLEENGKFSAMIGQHTQTRPSLGAIEKLICARSVSVKALDTRSSYGINPPSVVDVFAAEGKDKFITNRGKNDGYYLRVYDQEVVDELIRIDKEYRVLHDRYVAALRTLQPFTREHLESARVAAQTEGV